VDTAFPAELDVIEHDRFHIFGPKGVKIEDSIDRKLHRIRRKGRIEGIGVRGIHVNSTLPGKGFP
jgi:hypothetical protein